MPVVSFVGESSRACWRLSCYFFGTVCMPFSPLYCRPALAKFEYEPTYPFAIVLLWHGGWVGWWMDGLVGGWVCRAVRGWCFVGQVEADVVLVRLLCSAGGMGISTPCRMWTRENSIVVLGVSEL